MRNLLLLALTVACTVGDTFIPTFAPANPAPLNLITSAAWGGYSVARKLTNTYSGGAFRAKKVDGATLDIGFTSSGITDTNALVTFASNATVFADVIYDQSGNGRYLSNSCCATTTTNNVMFVVADGIPVIDPDSGRLRGSVHSTDVQQTLPLADVPALPVDYLTVLQAQTHVTTAKFVQIGASTQAGLQQVDSGGQKFRANNGATLNSSSNYVTGTNYLLTLHFEVGASDSIQINNDSAVVGTAGDNDPLGAPRIGNAPTTALYYFYEWLVFDNNTLSSGDKTTLQDNINDFYFIW